jgi:hypothetical protein
MPSLVGDFAHPIYTPTSRWTEGDSLQERADTLAIHFRIVARAQSCDQ